MSGSKNDPVELRLSRYSFGTGDRFAHQAGAQLGAVEAAAAQGVQIDIVWNKSYREHSTIGSNPAQTREAADAAVASLRSRSEAEPGSVFWKARHFLDADHIRLDTVGEFLPYCDFYTIDVADKIGQQGPDDLSEAFQKASARWIDTDIAVPGLKEPLRISASTRDMVSDQYLAAARGARQIYEGICEHRRPSDTVIEVSMDETSRPQSPGEIFLILLALSIEELPLQTFAPRFSGRFNKGVQYVGDPAAFEEEFEADALILRYAASVLGFPSNLKLSLHSGSDKFAIYPGIRRILETHDLGIHVKTAGTTWLEEIIGLCEAGGDGLEMAKTIYNMCVEHIDELSAPYAEVIDIDQAKLVSTESLDRLSASELASMIRHDPENPHYNPSMRQLFHVGYKMAAKLGQDFLDQLEKHEQVIAEQVHKNLFERHITKIFPGVR